MNRFANPEFWYNLLSSPCDEHASRFYSLPTPLLWKSLHTLRESHVMSRSILWSILYIMRTLHLRERMPLSRLYPLLPPGMYSVVVLLYDFSIINEEDCSSCFDLLFAPAPIDPKDVEFMYRDSISLTDQEVAYLDVSLTRNFANVVVNGFHHLVVSLPMIETMMEVHGFYYHHLTAKDLLIPGNFVSDVGFSVRASYFSPS